MFVSKPGMPSSTLLILIPAPASDTRQTQSTSFEPTVPAERPGGQNLWRVRGGVEEGLHGWAYPAQVYFIKPEPPVLNFTVQSFLVGHARGRICVSLQWHSVMSHGGEYTVELWQGPAGQPSCGGGELIGTL